MTPLATAVLWLVLSILAAPLVGRAIRLCHDRDACRTCQAVRAARAARAPIPGRCLCCPGTPLVADVITHSALVHDPARVRGPEDSTRWSTR